MNSTIRESKRKIAVRKWGNGHGILLPKVYIDMLGLVGGEVKTVIKGNTIMITKASRVQPKIITLKDMIRGMDKKRRHKLVDFGKPRGNELW